MMTKNWRSKSGQVSRIIRKITSRIHRFLFGSGKDNWPDAWADTTLFI